MTKEPKPPANTTNKEDMQRELRDEIEFLHNNPPELSKPKPFYRQKPKSDAAKAATLRATAAGSAWTPYSIAKHPTCRSTEELLRSQKALRQAQRDLTWRLEELLDLLSNLETEIDSRRGG